MRLKMMNNFEKGEEKTTVKQLTDYFEFKWNDMQFTFSVKPDIFVRPNAKIWDVVRSIRVDFDTTTILGFSKHKSISILYKANSNKSLEERFKEKIELFLYRMNAYWRACEGGWQSWNKLCDRERKKFVRKHKLSEHPFGMEIEDKLLEGDRVNGIKIKKVINFIDKSCLNSKVYFPFSIEWTMTYNLDGHYNWRGCSSYIPDISKTSLLDLRSYENGYESAHGQMTIGNIKNTEEHLECYSILKTVFDDTIKYVPAFDVEDLQTIFTSCNNSFWTKLADVNKYAFNVESYERSDKSISFRIEFGNGSLIRIELNTELYDTYDTCIFKISACCLPGGTHRTWRDSIAYENLETYELISPSKVKQAIDWLLKEFNDSENIPDHLTEDISEVFFKKFEKEMPAMFRKKCRDCPENTGLYKKLDYNMNMWFSNESLKSVCLSNIENLILQSNNSGKTREIVSAWMSKLDVNGRFYREVQNVYDIVTYIGSRESGIVRSDELMKQCHKIAEHFKKQIDKDCNLSIWEYTQDQMNRSLEQLIRDICNPAEYESTFAYYTGLVKDLEKGTEKKLNDSPPPLTDDWIRHNFNEINDRLKAMEGQVKGVNKSCSKMHESFNKLVKEMTDLYHGKDNELKLIQDCLERVERKLWPREYEAMDKNPFAHWVLKATMKRPISRWDCNKCKEDSTNGGDCENCYKCNEGSEFTPID